MFTSPRSLTQRSVLQLLVSPLEGINDQDGDRDAHQCFRLESFVICVWYCILKIIRDVIDVHSGELAKLWKEEREEESKTSQHSHRYCWVILNLISDKIPVPKPH